jgi:hypothetical protein
VHCIAVPIDMAPSSATSSPKPVLCTSRSARERAGPEAVAAWRCPSRAVGEDQALVAWHDRADGPAALSSAMTAIDAWDRIASVLRFALPGPHASIPVLART